VAGWDSHKLKTAIPTGHPPGGLFGDPERPKTGLWEFFFVIKQDLSVREGAPGAVHHKAPNYTSMGATKELHALHFSWQQVASQRPRQNPRW
jgi:hypothetical protein